MMKPLLKRVSNWVGLVRNELQAEGSGCLPPSHLAEKLEDAERLPSYAAETGIKVEPGMHDDILNPRIAGNVLSGLTRFAAKLRRPKMLTSSLERLETWVVSGWSWVHDFVQVLKPARFSALVVVAAGLLLFTPQGGELTRRLGLGSGGVGLWETIWFFICVIFWALQSWFWARLMIDAVYGLKREVTFGDDQERKRRVAWMNERFPPFLGLVAFWVAAAALSSSSHWGLAAVMFIVGFGSYFLLMAHQERTHPMRKRIPKGMGQPGASWWWNLFAPAAKNLTHYEKWKDFPKAARIVRKVSFALALGALISTILAPDIYGEWLGSAAATFFGLAIIVPAGSLIVFLSHRCGSEAFTCDRGWEPFQVSLPLLLILFLWAVYASNRFDTHAVRLADPKDSKAPAERLELPAAVKAWYDALPDNVRNSGGKIPFIIVAAAGGGSRAAYWTATVFGALEDEIPDFHRYLFAISGVSGGSLGATVYRTLLKTPPDKLPEKAKCLPEKRFRNNQQKSFKDGSDIPRGPYECAGQRVLSRDFLAPVVGSLLLPDLLQRFLPISAMGIPIPDRAAALEMGFERAWEVAGFPSDTWRGRGFNSLFKSANESELPALLLNGTHVATGKRIITSSVKIQNSGLLDTYDFFKLVDGDVWIATAVLNSARFTYVSPPGRMWSTQGNHIKDNGFIVDGGYFENFGAITALQLMRSARELAPIKGRIEPIFIQISSDPAWLDDLKSAEPNPIDGRGSVYLNEVLSPLRAMLDTRTARGVLAAKQLFEKEPQMENQTFHFRLCPADDGFKPALGWVLSSRAEENIWKGLRLNTCANKKAKDELIELLKQFGIDNSSAPH